MNSFSLNENRKEDIPQVSKEEVRELIFGMETNKASGPDGSPAEFYQKIWNVLKHDLLHMFNEFHAGDFPMFSLNFGVITSYPK